MHNLFQCNIAPLNYKKSIQKKIKGLLMQIKSNVFQFCAVLLL